MILINSASFLEIVTEVIATSNMPVVGAYVEHNSSFSVTALTPITTNTNGTTAVTVVGVATGSAVRQLKALSVFNAGTAAKLVTLRMDTSGTKHIIVRVTLDVSDMLQFSDTDGWFVLNSIGQVKTGASIALEDGSVTTVKIVDANVTNAKLANMVAATVKGRNSGTGAPQDLDMDTLFSIFKGKIPVAYCFALSDETNAIGSTGDKVRGIRIPFAFNLTAVTASLSVAQSAGNALTLDVLRDSTSLLDTKLVFTNGSLLCTTATRSAAVIAAPLMSAQDAIKGNVFQVGTAAALGAKITLHGFMA